jgi:hypothetical protein
MGPAREKKQRPRPSSVMQQRSSTDERTTPVARRPTTSLDFERYHASPARSPGNGGNVKVVVRARPMKDSETRCLVSMNGCTTTIRPAQDDSRRRTEIGERSFVFDHSMWSVDDSCGQKIGQEDMYNVVGREFLDHNIEGYNTCILAYGQTGSGKTHTMLGVADEPGIIINGGPTKYRHRRLAHAVKQSALAPALSCRSSWLLQGLWKCR